MEPVKLPTEANFPFTAYHPVYGARTAKDAAESTEMFVGDPLDWFATAEEADAARTQREAEIVVAHRLQNRLDHAKGEDHEVNPAVVENSVAADLRIKAGLAEP